MLNLTYEYKAIPTPEQVQIIEHTLTVCHQVWNFALRERKDWINSRKCQINACSILQWVCWKRGVYFAKVNKDYTSQVCPQCDAHTGKKDLKDRIHSCPECGYTAHRDVAAAQIVRNRGLSGVGRILDIKENACGDDLAGTGNRLVRNPRSRKKGGEARLHTAS